MATVAPRNREKTVKPRHLKRRKAEEHCDRLNAELHRHADDTAVSSEVLSERRLWLTTMGFPIWTTRFEVKRALKFVHYRVVAMER